MARYIQSHEGVYINADLVAEFYHDATRDTTYIQYPGEGGWHLFTGDLTNELLKEQEPVEPKTHEIVVGISGATRSEYLCGDCGCGLVKNDKWQTKFCPECGRGVKWDA